MANEFVNISYSSFFDRPAVEKAVGKANKQNLSKAGAFVRTAARDLIRKRKRISRPGEPPSSHEGSLRRLILFAFDGKESVVIGPKLFKNQNPTGPSLLEFGGRLGKNVYQPRPFMGPALEREADKFPDLWANSVK